MSEIAGFGEFRGELERIMKSLDSTLPDLSGFEALSDSLAPVFDQVSETITSTFVGSDSFRSLFTQIQDMMTSQVQDTMTALYSETLPSLRLPDPSESLQVAQRTTQMPEPASSSVGVSNSDDPFENTTRLTPEMKVMLMVVLIEIVFMALLQALLEFRTDPQLAEIAELLRERNELLQRLLETSEALPTGGR